MAGGFEPPRGGLLPITPPTHVNLNTPLRLARSASLASFIINDNHNGEVNFIDIRLCSTRQLLRRSIPIFSHMLLSISEFVQGALKIISRKKKLANWRNQRKHKFFSY